MEETGLRAMLRNILGRRRPAASKEEAEDVYPRFHGPSSTGSGIHFEEMFPPTPLPKTMMENTNLDPVAMASTISRARLEAIGSLAEGDYENFLVMGKHCIDAHAQATKAMMEDVIARIEAGEKFDWMSEIAHLKDGLRKYCRAIVDEAELLAIKDGEGSVISSPSPKQPLTTLTKLSTTFTKYSTISPNTSIDYSNDPTAPSTVLSDLKTSPPLLSDSETSLPYTMSDYSSEGHLLASSRRRLCLYTVSNEDWIVGSPRSPSTSPSVRLPENMSPVDESIHIGVIMGIFGKLYTMAKIMQTILLSYGMELDSSKTGLLYWIKVSEEYIKSQDMLALVETVENLFYAMYARVLIELANIELCNTFRVDVRSLRNHRPFILPEPDHLYRIVLAFKDVLDSPSIRSILRTEILQRFQNEYIHTAIQKAIGAEGGVGYSTIDPLGYRLHAKSIITNRTGPYCIKWKELISFFNLLPEKVMVMWSEKYLTMAPVSVIPSDIPFDQLPFLNHSLIAVDTREAEIKKDHRMATLAKLEGTSIGEERQKDPKSGIYHLAKQRRCVCPSLCRCAKDCTDNVLYQCPCAERQVRIMMIKRGLNYRPPTADFATTAGTLTRMYFLGLASLRPDVTERQIADELQRAFEAMAHLIGSEREKMLPKRSLSDQRSSQKSRSEMTSPSESHSENNAPKRANSEKTVPKKSNGERISPTYCYSNRKTAHKRQ